MEPMTSMEGNPPPAEAPPAEPTRRGRSRVRMAVAGLAVAAVLTTWGAASVLAASPDPSTSGSPAASDSAGGNGSDNSGNADHNCPNDSTGSDSGGDATSS